jgi:hypothetical protein
MYCNRKKDFQRFRPGNTRVPKFLHERPLHNSQELIQMEFTEKEIFNQISVSLGHKYVKLFKSKILI